MKKPIYRPQHNFLLVRVDKAKDETTESGIILPSVSAAPKPATGVVEALGPEAKIECKVGDRVLFPPYIAASIDSIAVDLGEHIFLLDQQILAVVGEHDPARDPCPVCGALPERTIH